MKLAGLSLKQAPPISVPFRFFLSAAFFGALSALLLIYLGPEVLVSRWTAGTLAITHGIVLGFITSVIFGALQQILPVLAGAIIPKPKFFAWILHLLWISGVITLITAFLYGGNLLFTASLLLLGSCVFLFCLLCAYALFHASSKSESVMGMRLAIFSLFITVILGILLGMGHIGQLLLLRPAGSNLHAMWGLIGWVSLMIISVAGQVVPMFQITKPYPARLIRLLPVGLFVLLLMHSIILVITLFLNGDKFNSPLLWKTVTLIIEATVSLFLLSFAYHTLRLQKKRLRRIKDTHINYWKIACNLLILSIVGWWLGKAVDNNHLSEQLQLLSVVLFLMGFVVAVVTAMLYKIVAFLVWFHLHELNNQLQLAGKSGFTVPHMKTVITVAQAKLQYMTFLVALCSLPLAIFSPNYFSQIAGILWFIYFTVMLINISKAIFMFRKYS